MSSVVSFECRIPERDTTFSVSSALIYLKGELAGNVTLILEQVGEPVDDELLLARLQLSFPGHGKLVPAVDVQAAGTQQRVRFYSSSIRPDGLQPRLADLFWLSGAEAGTESPFIGRDVKLAEATHLGLLHLTAAQDPENVPRY